ncbi:MAG: FimB/Mfa2 family fimbrial subunit [Tannerellaceae bacterium]|jgi:hypothetical protein|nr:FimB/Mfa2 family fimbrial subunit [Tannerellaceae bacterium]
MNKVQMKTLRIIIALAVLASCVKEPLYNTNHPEHGKIVALVTDWTDRSEDVAIPGAYTVKAGTYTAGVDMQNTSQHSHTANIDHLFVAGQYNLCIYNEADGVTVNGTTATADYAVGPGWFFTGTESLTVEEDKDYTVTVAMRQQVRALTLELDVQGDAADRITGIDATLSGIAGAINIENGNPEGDAVTLTPAFTQTEGKYTAVMRLLGMAGSEQTLSLTLHFTDADPQPYTLMSDLSEQLSAFNEGKKTPLVLRSVLVATPSATELTVTITDWIPKEIIQGTAD